MKRPLLTFFLLWGMAMALHAQPDLPKLFTTATQNFLVSKANLDPVFQQSKGTTFSLPIHQQQQLVLQIKMNEVNGPSVHTIGATIEGYPDAWITVTQYSDKGKVLYTGELISRKLGKVYQIRLSDNEYIDFTLKETATILVED